MPQSKSFWRRFSIRSAYGQLVALIFVPMSFLAVLGGSFVLNEISKTYELQQRSHATLILSRYQQTGNALNNLLAQHPDQVLQAHDILQIILNEPQVIRVVIIDQDKKIILQSGKPVDPEWLKAINFNQNIRHQKYQLEIDNNQLNAHAVYALKLDKLESENDYRNIQMHLDLLRNSHVGVQEDLLSDIIKKNRATQNNSNSIANEPTVTPIQDTSTNPKNSEFDHITSEQSQKIIPTRWLLIELDPNPFIVAYYRVIIILGILVFTILALLLIILNNYSRRWIAPIYEMRLQLKTMDAENLRTLNSKTTGELASLQKDMSQLLKRLSHNFGDLRDHNEQIEQDYRQTMDRLELQNIAYRRNLEQSKQANKAKSAFLANISHELRTPLNSIDGFVNLMLRRNTQNDENQLYLQTIHKSSAHLLALINDVLDFSKIDAGKLELELTTFSLEQTIFDVLDMLSSLASEKNLNLAMHYDEKLPVYVIGDALRFKQILTNLVSNAIKFTAEGEVIVRTRLEYQDQQHLGIYCSVQDTGIGLSSTDSNKLFNSFSQGDTSVTRQYGGTGLGLVISKQLVTLMQGQIGFENNQERNPTEKGASFWFTAQFEYQPESVEQDIDLSDLHVLSYLSHASTANILKQYLEQYQVASYRESASIIDLFAHLNKFNQKENAWLIVEHTGYLANLLSEIRLRYQGHLLIYGYQLQLDPNILKQYQAIALYQPLSRIHLINILQNNQNNIYSRSYFNGKGLHVLAVDDHLPNLLVLEALLNELNVKVTTVNSGQSALNHIQAFIDNQQNHTMNHEYSYDLIFMDIQMPMMSGIEATQAIRALEQHHQIEEIPIVALTAHAMADEKENILNSGMNDYVTKPIQLEQLIDILQKWTVNKSSLDNHHLFIEHNEDILHNSQNINTANTDSQIIDWQQSIQLSANKVDLAQDLLKMLIDSFAKDQAEMQQLIDDEDFPQLEQILHRLYGATRYVGVPQLQQISGEFEQFVAQLRKQQRRADDEFAQQVQQRFEQLLQAMQAVREQAVHYLNDESDH
ncbi:MULTISPECIES: ATP-binding protein [unclassified Acinetobacter]|uniref:ATP-binding protein n=1 Tax=unclassified Acinetobacter TaxID=196816 RepID=UPI0035BA4309